MRDGVTLADSLVAWAGITASLNADGDTNLVAGVIVTGNYFDTLGVRRPRAVCSHRATMSRLERIP